MDVSVMHGADCNTDHRILRAKVVVERRKYFRKDAAGTTVRRWGCGKAKVW